MSGKYVLPPKIHYAQSQLIMEHPGNNDLIIVQENGSDLFTDGDVVGNIESEDRMKTTTKFERIIKFHLR